MKIMNNNIQNLINRFSANIDYYTSKKENFNEQECRQEFIDHLLIELGWDVGNRKGDEPEYREVLVEDYSTSTDRPDYTLQRCGIPIMFVEAKKPSVNITTDISPSFQARRYGWNAGHKIVILTNFEYLAIYNTEYEPKPGQEVEAARIKLYHFTEYNNKFDEIKELISREAVYSDDYDEKISLYANDYDTKKIDEKFLNQINEWRLLLSKDLYYNHSIKDINKINDLVQRFINQLVFIRICEDNNLPLLNSLQDALSKEDACESIKALIMATDKRYNSGLFGNNSIIYNISSELLCTIIKDLYYPNSVYMFDIIEPSLLGKIYELFLVENVVLDDNNIILTKKKNYITKKDYTTKSIVTTKTEIVKKIVLNALKDKCHNKTPKEIKALKVADISCGSGVFLEETFDYLQNACLHWYEKNDKSKIIEYEPNKFKLSLDEKKEILTKCIFGIDIDYYASEVAKFTLLMKLIENENKPSVKKCNPILPNLDKNILCGNSLIDFDDVDISEKTDSILDINPFDWKEINDNNKFDAIIGNPPYVSTEGMKLISDAKEIEIYKEKYTSTYKQFDKYFLFIERGMEKLKDDGILSFIVPNKFFTNEAGKKLRTIIARNYYLKDIIDFGATQLFDDKTIYSAIITLEKKGCPEFTYSYMTSLYQMYDQTTNPLEFNNIFLKQEGWILTTDKIARDMIFKIEKKGIPLFDEVDIINGIQTSASGIYDFSNDEVEKENESYYFVNKKGKKYRIEKDIVKPFFKPTKAKEKGIKSYDLWESNKYIIFPYNSNGKLYEKEYMLEKFPYTYKYLLDNIDKLCPKKLKIAGITGKRDVPNATMDTWYQYGRTQALAAFNNTPKLICAVLRYFGEQMYLYDPYDHIIASGGTAGYIAIKQKEDSKYALEFIQAWLNNSRTERILRVYGSNFENDFVARGTRILKKLKIISINFEDNEQNNIYCRVVENTRKIYRINQDLHYADMKSKKILRRTKEKLITDIENDIGILYDLEW